ncbi:hypothetical protein S83_048188, partial [Arachis hypogaea]
FESGYGFDSDDELQRLIKIEKDPLVGFRVKSNRKYRQEGPFGHTEGMVKDRVVNFQCELDAAATKLQKVYKSYHTRRNLADCAVVVEELWWKALDFAALKRSSVSFFDVEKQESAVSRWARARTRAAKAANLCERFEQRRHVGSKEGLVKVPNLNRRPRGWKSHLLQILKGSIARRVFFRSIMLASAISIVSLLRAFSAFDLPDLAPVTLTYTDCVAAERRKLDGQRGQRPYEEATVGLRSQEPLRRRRFGDGRRRHEAHGILQRYRCPQAPVLLPQAEENRRAHKPSSRIHSGGERIFLLFVIHTPQLESQSLQTRDTMLPRSSVTLM